MRTGTSTIIPLLTVVVAFAAGSLLVKGGLGRDAKGYVYDRQFDEVMQHVERQFVDEVDLETVYQAAIEGVVAELGDPSSRFMRASEYQALRLHTRSDYGGVGLEVVDRNGYATVVATTPGTPGARAGVRTGDRILEVDGEPTGSRGDGAEDLLRGEPGTTVDIVVSRTGVEQALTFRLSREMIQVSSVPFAELLPGRVGYVPLRHFNDTARQEVRAAIDSLAAEGMTSLILDLRDNPGGLLEEGVGVADLFLDRGLTIVETRGRASVQTETFRAVESQAYPDLPLVVLVKERSASSAEIVAGALQDHDRALLIGGPTYGKGSVQSLFRLPGGPVLRLTTARWFTPSGRSIQKGRSDDGSLERTAIAVAGDPVERPNLEDRAEFRSSAGRVLYGGGGIVPDLWILPDTLDRRELAAVRSVFSSGRGFVRALEEWATASLEEEREGPPDITPDSADIAGLHQRLAAQGSETTLDDLLEARRYVGYHMLRELAFQAGNERGRFLSAMEGDRQLQAALRLLGASRSQAELYRLASSSSWQPSSAPLTGGR